ncbi:nitrilase, partial [Candidatus Poribacteria bacterium]|nr:nitrilase [Candidatus Poribacteria bacterium]
MEPIRYAAAACQTDHPAPETRVDIKRSADRMLEMIDMTVEGHSPFLPVRLLAFPEFGHAVP